MTEITKDFVLSEIKKISFFLQHSGMFDNFTPRSRNDLEGLPIEWVSVETDGEVQLTPNGEPHWKTAELKGKLKDKDLYLKIEKSPDRNIYALVYDNKTYKTSSMPKLKSIVDSLNAGETPRPKYLQVVYNTLSKRKNDISKYIQPHYLKGISESPWDILVTKDVSRIYLKMTITTDEPEKVIAELKKGNFYRLDSIGVYVKHLMKKANLDPEDFTITHRLIRIGDTAGFTISIK